MCVYFTCFPFNSIMFKDQCPLYNISWIDTFWLHRHQIRNSLVAAIPACVYTMSLTPTPPTSKMSTPKMSVLTAHGMIQTSRASPHFCLSSSPWVSFMFVPLPWLASMFMYEKKVHNEMLRDSTGVIRAGNMTNSASDYQ